MFTAPSRHATWWIERSHHAAAARGGAIPHHVFSASMAVLRKLRKKSYGLLPRMAAPVAGFVCSTSSLSTRRRFGEQIGCSRSPLP